jgi:hypothetical protein
MLGSENIIGIPSFLASVGMTPPSTFLSCIVAIFITFIFFIFGKRYILNVDILSFLLCLHFLIIYGRNTDLVYLLPVWISIWLHAQKFRNHRLYLLPILLSFWIPARIVGIFEINWLLQWRVFSLLLATLYLIYRSVSLRNSLNQKTFN